MRINIVATVKSKRPPAKPAVGLFDKRDLAMLHTLFKKRDRALLNKVDRALSRRRS